MLDIFSVFVFLYLFMYCIECIIQECKRELMGQTRGRNGAHLYFVHRSMTFTSIATTKKVRVEILYEKKGNQQSNGSCWFGSGGGDV